MATWQAANEKAKFSALFDTAESEGPQLIHRRRLKFVVATAEEFERRVAEAREVEPKKFVSAWDALRLSFDEGYDLELPKREWKSRPVDFI